MSVTSRSQEAAAGAPDTVPRDRARRGALNQPWRAAVAVAELVLAGLVLWFATSVWVDGVSTITLSPGDIEVTQLHGNLIAAAIGLGAVAALLVLDAVRQLMLALRTRSKSRKREPWPDLDEDS